MSLEQFDAAIANTCGPQNCQIVEQARKAIKLCTEPEGIVEFEHATAIPAYLQEAVASGVVGTQGEDGEMRQATQDDLDNIFGQAKDSLLGYNAEVARTASYLAETSGKLCSSGPETFTSSDPDLSLIITTCGESLAHGIDHLNHPHTTEVEVRLSTPQQ